MNNIVLHNQFTTPSNDLVMSTCGGMSIQEFIDSFGIPEESFSSLKVFIGGYYVEQSMYKHVRPKPDTPVKIIVVPQEDDQTFAMIAMIALAVASQGIATALVPAGGWGAAAVSVGITIAGSLAINAMFPPPIADQYQEQEEGSKSLTIAGSRNSFSYDKAIPRIYSKGLKFFPPHAGQPYTTSFGGKQYLFMLFDLGYAPLEISELKIGETDIAEFEEVDYKFHESIDSGLELEYFTSDIESEPVNIEMVDADPSITRQTSEDFKYAQVDLSFPNGLYGITELGDHVFETVSFEVTLYDDSLVLISDANVTVEDLGNVTGVTVTNTTTTDFYLNGRTNDAFSLTLEIRVAIGTVPDFISVGLVRTTSSSNGFNTINTCFYNTLRTFRTGVSIKQFRLVDETVPSYASHSMLEMRIRATDQLNGVIDNFSCIAASKLRSFEKYAEQNLLKYSQDFENIAWSGAATVDPNVIAAPDGTMTGDKIEDNSAVAVQIIEQTLSIVDGDTDLYTFSVYMKEGAVDAIRTGEIAFSIIGPTSIARWITWNWADPTSPNIPSGVYGVTVTDEGDGWFRFAITVMNNGLSNTSIRCDLYPTVWVAGGTSTAYCYCWGAQLNQRKNLFTKNTSFDDANWTKLCSITANSITAPDGTLTADTFTENAVTEQHYVSQAPDVIFENTYTISCYVKFIAGGHGIATLTMWGETYIDFDIENGILISLPSGSNYTNANITDHGSGWYRISCTFKKTNDNAGAYVLSYNGISRVYLGSGLPQFYIWGAVLVEGQDQEELAPYYHTTDTSYLTSGNIFNAPAVTDNPAWVYTDVLTGTMNQRPKSDDRINWIELKRWADFCDKLSMGENGIESKSHTCNFVLDYSTTIYKLLSDIASIGRASPDIYDDMYSVIFDEPKINKVQIFSNMNTSDFSSSRVYTEIPDAVRISFRDPESDWQMRELVVYNDGKNIDNASVFEDIKSPMLISSEEAYRNGRYWLKQASLRKESITFKTDLDWLECKRGDFVGLQMDVMLAGGTVCRVKSVVGQVVIVDSDPTMNGNNVDYFELRTQAGEIISGPVAFYNAGSTFEIDLGIDGASYGDLLVINSSGKKTYDLLIKQIDVNSDQSAIVTCVEYAPELYDLASDPIPTYDPSIHNIYNAKNTPNRLAELSITEIASILDKKTYISIVLNYAPDTGIIPYSYRIYKQDENSEWIFQRATVDLSYTWGESILAINTEIIGVQHCFSVVGVAESGEFLDPALGIQSCIVPVGDITIPDPPDYFVVENTAENFKRFWWDYKNVVRQEDIEGFIIRYTRSTLTTPDWGSATPLHNGILLDPPFEIRALPPGTQKVLIKAIDTSKNLSTDSTVISFEMGDNAVENVLFTKSFSPSWSGVLIDGSVDLTTTPGTLSADPTTSGSMWNVAPTVLMWTDDANLMWVTPNDSFKWVESVVLTVGGITRILQEGNGEVKLYYTSGDITGQEDPDNLVLSPENFLDAIDWSGTATVSASAFPAPDGSNRAFRVNDTSGSAIQILSAADITIVQFVNYIVSISIRKDSVPKTTRSCNIILSFGEILLEAESIQLDTMTGEFNVGNLTGLVIDSGVIDEGQWWRPYFIVATRGGNTRARLNIAPAYSSSSDFSIADATLINGIDAFGAFVAETDVYIPFIPYSENIFNDPTISLIPYTSPVILPSGTYSVVIDSPQSVDVNSLSLLDWITDVPDINEYFNDEVVSSTGDTRITFTKTFTQVTNISITVQEDTFDAVSCRIMNKTNTYVDIRCFSASTTQVQGLVDIRVQGY